MAINYIMLQFIAVYLWNWVIVPLSLMITIPFRQYNVPLVSRHFIYDILGVKHNIVYDSPIIEHGFLLANHRSFMDAHMDSLISNSALVNRYMVILGAPVFVLLAYLENRVIFINRGKDKRDNVYTKCVSHMLKYNTRIVIYTEGTRNSYSSLNSEDDLRNYIKFGFLKSVYEDKLYPVQLQISSNKEKAFNEKKMSLAFGVKINTRISKPIHPKDFSTETEFFNEIIRVWYDCYKTTHV